MTTIMQKELAKGFKAISSAYSKSAIPILNTVKVRLELAFADIEYTDLDICVRVRVPLTEPVDEVSEFMFDYLTLKKAVGALKGELAISCAGIGDSNTFLSNDEHVKEYLVKDFPEFNMKHDLAVSKFGIRKTRTVAKAMLSTINIRDPRYHIRGACFDFRKDIEGFRIVSCDGHRMVRLDLPMVNTQYNTKGGRYIVPHLALKVMASMPESPCYVEMSETRSTFIFEKVTISVKNVDSDYPEYERLIPSASKHEAVLLKKRLMPSLVLCKKLNKAEAVACEIKSGDLYISHPTKAVITGESICRSEYESHTVGMNATYLHSLVDILDESFVRVSFLEPMEAIKICGTVDDIPTTCVLMPKRLK